MEHNPVMLREVVDALSLRPGAVLVDCTFGRGGHLLELMKHCGATGRAIALDKDPEAVAVGRRLARRHARLSVLQASFDELGPITEHEGVYGRVDGVLFDLGMSSPQLDDASRGFSFNQTGPLDMRMDPSAGVSAAEWLDRVKERELSDVLRDFGEERYARRIARAVVQARRRSPIRTTTDLAEIVRRASPTRERSKHPATRSFQAIRIFINRELGSLAHALEQVPGVLAPGGRLAVISFHSLEDRLVKRFIRDRARREPSEEPRIRPVGKPMFPSQAELAVNPRARSAVLRVAERTRP